MWALSNEPRLSGSPILAMMLTGGQTDVQGLPKEWALGWESFVPALLPGHAAKFSQTEVHSFVDPLYGRLHHAPLSEQIEPAERRSRSA